MKMLYIKQIESAIPKLINLDLPIKFAYKLNMSMTEIDKHISQLHNFRIDFLNKHGDKQNGGIAIKKELIKRFDDEMEELLQEEIELKPINIPLSVLMDTNIRLTAIEIEALKNSGIIVDDINSNED